MPNMYDMDMRSYNHAIARWTAIDTVTHHALSTYNAFDNNPISYADPSGTDSNVGNFGLGRSGDYADNIQIIKVLSYKK
ncbi:MAG: hypothetical protein HKP48_10360 [Winogradskyella sp.]|nr:hypothetical protein [Winogradskyella sp.]NNK23666.1 hypothetical protein [Winogradskyella sp.]